MIGKHEPGVDVERGAGADPPNRIPQRIGRGRPLLGGDSGFPGRWRAIKKGFSKLIRIREPRSPVMTNRGERGIWQPAAEGA